MPAPLVAAAAAKPVSEAVQGIVKVLSTDIVKAEGNIYRRVRKKVPLTDADGRILLTKKGRVRYTTIIQDEPIALEGHLNGIGLLGMGLAALAATVAWNGITVGVLGVGQFTLFKGLRQTLDEERARRPPRSA